MTVEIEDELIEFKKSKDSVWQLTSPYGYGKTWRLENAFADGIHGNNAKWKVPHFNFPEIESKKEFETIICSGGGIIRKLSLLGIELDITKMNTKFISISICVLIYVAYYGFNYDAFYLVLTIILFALLMLLYFKKPKIVIIEEIDRNNKNGILLSDLLAFLASHSIKTIIVGEWKESRALREKYVEKTIEITREQMIITAKEMLEKENLENTFDGVKEAFYTKDDFNLRDVNKGIKFIKEGIKDERFEPIEDYDMNYVYKVIFLEQYCENRNPIAFKKLKNDKNYHDKIYGYYMKEIKESINNEIIKEEINKNDKDAIDFFKLLLGLDLESKDRYTKWLQAYYEFTGFEPIRYCDDKTLINKIDEVKIYMEQGKYNSEFIIYIYCHSRILIDIFKEYYISEKLNNTLNEDYIWRMLEKSYSHHKIYLKTLTDMYCAILPNGTAFEDKPDKCLINGNWYSLEEALELKFGKDVKNFIIKMVKYVNEHIFLWYNLKQYAKYLEGNENLKDEDITYLLSSLEFCDLDKITTERFWNLFKLINNTHIENRDNVKNTLKNYEKTIVDNTNRKCIISKIIESLK